jgi:hypothetical protein
MVADIGREYEKVHNDTDVTVLQFVIHLMAIKSKYNYSN